jgi:hypothetical protein
MAVSVFLGLNGVFRRPLRRLGAGVFADEEGEGGDLAEGGGKGEEEAGDGKLAAVLRQQPAARADKGDKEEGEGKGEQQKGAAFGHGVVGSAKGGIIADAARRV